MEFALHVKMSVSENNVGLQNYIKSLESRCEDIKARWKQRRANPSAVEEVLKGAGEVGSEVIEIEAALAALAVINDQSCHGKLGLSEALLTRLQEMEKRYGLEAASEPAAPDDAKKSEVCLLGWKFVLIGA